MTVQCEAYVRRSKFCMLKRNEACLQTVECDMT